MISTAGFRFVAVAALCGAALAAGCGGDTPADGHDSSGGAPGAGGTLSSTGGTVATGGSTSARISNRTRVTDSAQGSRTVRPAASRTAVARAPQSQSARPCASAAIR